MKNPKERDSEHVLEVAQVELWPIHLLKSEETTGKTVEDATTKTSKSKRLSKKYSFFAAAGFDCLTEEEKELFGFTSRTRPFRHRKPALQEEALKNLKSEIIAETNEAFDAFRCEMDLSFMEYRQNITKEMERRHKHQMRKLERFLRKLRRLSAERSAI